MNTSRLNKRSTLVLHLKSAGITETLNKWYHSTDKRLRSNQTTYYSTTPAGIWCNEKNTNSNHYAKRYHKKNTVLKKPAMES